jgi:hypothetical protein
MEAATLMGELEIIRPDGEITRFEIDGTIVKEQGPILIDWCDKCEKWKPCPGGAYEKQDGLSIIWFCGDCK